MVEATEVQCKKGTKKAILRQLMKEKCADSRNVGDYPILLFWNYYVESAAFATDN